jgi:protocatechuate 3,4-dioxygenase beta subunit
MNNFDHHSTQGARLAALLTALLLSACGGGGGNPGTVSSGSGSTGTGGTGGTAVTASPTVTLAFANAAGASTSSLTGATPLTVKATVLGADKKPVPNAIVTFATDAALGVFSPTAGTALTDVNGVASVTMRTASLSAGGAGSVTASTSVAGATVTGTGNYAVGATALSFGTLSASPSSLQAYGSTVLSVDLLSGSAKYTSQQINVSFGSACVSAGKATLSTTVATNNGTAQTVYRDKGCGNNDTITVSADGVTRPATTTLTIAPPAAASVQFVSAAPLNQSIVIRGQGGNGRTETATLTFKVVDSFGNPLAGKQVNFTASTPLVTVNKMSDTTDAAGTISTTVNSGSTPTSFRVQATLPNTATANAADISTQSDSIVVTTGLPVQRAFTIGTETFNVEGWTINTSGANPATHITVSLGDAFGNLVPDGTPIVFQTNLGAVGTSSSGGCITTNGSCTVDYRAQNPRTASPGLPATPCNAQSADSTRTGLATICASTSDGSNTLFAKTSVFLSGSTAVNTFLNGSPVSFNALAPNDLGTIRSSETKVFQLLISDVNLNPMPAGSRVEITSMLNGNAAPVAPATVANIVPHGTNGDDSTGNGISGNQGTTHTFSISSTQPTECKNATQASFNVTVTTPGNSSTNIPFKLSFSCP